MVVVLVTVMMGAAHIGAATLARHRAQAAADLAALAGAAHLPTGMGPACTRAERLARVMHALAVSCIVDGLDLVVTVEVSPALGGRWIGPATAVARAGPQEVRDQGRLDLADLSLRENVFRGRSAGPSPSRPAALSSAWVGVRRVASPA